MPAGVKCRFFNLILQSGTGISLGKGGVELQGSLGGDLKLGSTPGKLVACEASFSSVISSKMWWSDFSFALYVFQYSSSTSSNETHVEGLM